MEKEFYFVRSGGRPEILFCVQGADLDAVEISTSFYFIICRK